MGNLCGCKCLEKTNSENEQVETKTQAEPTPVEFISVRDVLETGDICMLYRAGMEHPHCAMFVVYEDLGEHSPLLLLKGKTKPLPIEKFRHERDKSLRHASLVSANCRIFYGDYVKVLVYKLKKHKIIPGAHVDRVIDIVRKLEYHEDELKVIEDPQLSDACRSQYVCAFMLAHVMSQLGYISVQPHTVMPECVLKQFMFEEPISIKLPETTKGPLITGSPPFLAKLM